MFKEVERMIKELTESKMTWRELLRTQIQSTIKNDFTFQHVRLGILELLCLV